MSRMGESNSTMSGRGGRGGLGGLKVSVKSQDVPAESGRRPGWGVLGLNLVREHPLCLWAGARVEGRSLSVGSEERAGLESVTKTQETGRLP